MDRKPVNASNRLRTRIHKLQQSHQLVGIRIVVNLVWIVLVSSWGTIDVAVFKGSLVDVDVSRDSIVVSHLDCLRNSIHNGIKVLLYESLRVEVVNQVVRESGRSRVSVGSRKHHIVVRVKISKQGLKLLDNLVLNSTKNHSRIGRDESNALSSLSNDKSSCSKSHMNSVADLFRHSIPHHTNFSSWTGDIPNTSTDLIRRWVVFVRTLIFVVMSHDFDLLVAQRVERTCGDAKENQCKKGSIT
mmetsp:Transcript_18018/g.25172  ORF Transcript_18018/g.25172 Transcript_18018/m.25172 type:complete len:244 (-) Transcript_18018:58-789(-)